MVFLGAQMWPDWGLKYSQKTAFQKIFQFTILIMYSLFKTLLPPFRAVLALLNKSLKIKHTRKTRNCDANHSHGIYGLWRDRVVWTDEKMEVLFTQNCDFEKKFCIKESRRNTIYRIQNTIWREKGIPATALKTSINLLLFRADGEGVIDLIFLRGEHRKNMQYFGTSRILLERYLSMRKHLHHAVLMRFCICVTKLVLICKW